MKVFPLAGSLVAEGCFVTSLTAPRISPRGMAGFHHSRGGRAMIQRKIKIDFPIRHVIPRLFPVFPRIHQPPDLVPVPDDGTNSPEQN